MKPCNVIVVLVIIVLMIMIWQKMKTVSNYQRSLDYMVIGPDELMAMAHQGN